MVDDGLVEGAGELGRGVDAEVRVVAVEEGVSSKGFAVLGVA